MVPDRTLKGLPVVALLCALCAMPLLSGCATIAVADDGLPRASAAGEAAPLEFGDAERVAAFLSERVTGVCRTSQGEIPVSQAVSDVAFERSHLRIVLDVRDEPGARTAAEHVRTAVLGYDGSWGDLEVWSRDGSILATATR